MIVWTIDILEVVGLAIGLTAVLVYAIYQWWK